MRTEGIETLKAVARRSAWIVVLLVALGIVAMTLVRRSEGPQYQASADVILSPIDFSSAVAGINTYVDPQVVDATEQSLANSPQLYDAAAQSVGGRLGSGSDLQSATSASKNAGTITFSATGSNPDRVVAIANAVASTYQTWRANVTSTAIQKAMQRVQAQLARTPKGFPADHPAAQDLRRKDFVGCIDLTDAQLTGRGFMRDFVAAWAKVMNLDRFDLVGK